LIGIDTNVLVRYIVQDDARQAALATELIEGACSEANPGFISHIVLCELVWVLMSPKTYGATREQVGVVLDNLLHTKQFEIEHREVAYRALQDYQACGADYADCLVARVAQAVGCTTTYSFDKRAARLAGMTRLGAA
jgi:predicted nucleic-acid-binding protein